MSKLDVFAALQRKTGFEIVQEKETDNQLWMMGRCHPDRWGFFSLVINELIFASDSPNVPWTCDISKKYLRKGEKLVYGWRIIIQAAGVQEHYAQVTAVIMGAPRPSSAELQSQLLPGYKEGDVRGGFNEKGKGSGPAGSTPLAARRTGR